MSRVPHSADQRKWHNIHPMNRMKTRLLAAGLLAALCAAGSGLRAQAPAAGQVTAAQPPPIDAATLEKKVDELMNAYVKVNGFTGSVILAKEGKPLVAKGYGYANIEWQIPNAIDTKFRIGSITKQFTSMLIMQLREQGKIKLEDSACMYVTPCPDAWKPVTIHHLLTHTSGIPTYTGIAAWREVNMVPKTVDQMIAFFRDLPLQWTPGERYAYNNSGYFLLGVVIEKITGKKYEQALQDMILTPLGLKDTGYDWSKTIIPRRASGYSGRGGALGNAAALDMQQPYSAGSMYSTVEDLLKWDQALYTEKLLPEAAKTLMWTPFKDNYAYGWAIGTPAAGLFGGHRRIAHGGGINGFSSMIVRLPDAKVTVIVLANSDSVSSSNVGRDLAAIYFGQPYTVPAPRTIAKVDPKIYDQYVGKYELRPDFILNVTREGNSLMAQPTGPGQGKFEVFPESEMKFFAERPELTLTFFKGPDGKVAHVVVRQGGRDQQGKKIE
jgi:CubicO group peptidase (beta-lactamase class C family)